MITPTMPDGRINCSDTHPRQRLTVLDTHISYVDTGEGDPIVFLHGNPTSSYLWRNIIPYVSDLGRCLAPDLVGMGQSGKSPALAYRFVDHVRYLDTWFDALNLSNVTLVIHDWGSALGFHRAVRYPGQIRAIAYMEAVTTPMTWDDFGEAAGLFRAVRSEAGEHMILDQNAFVETILPKSIIRKLSDEEMNAYRAPYRTRENRLPTLVWPRQIPIDGDPAAVSAIVETYAKAMAQSDIPKLLIAGQPGAIIKDRVLAECRTWRNQTETSVPGIHFLQEDSPHEIGAALREFVKHCHKKTA